MGLISPLICVYLPTENLNNNFAAVFVILHRQSYSHWISFPFEVCVNSNELQHYTFINYLKYTVAYRLYSGKTQYNKKTK